MSMFLELESEDLLYVRTHDVAIFSTLLTLFIKCPG